MILPQFQVTRQIVPLAAFLRMTYNMASSGLLENSVLTNVISTTDGTIECAEWHLIVGAGPHCYQCYMMLIQAMWTPWTPLLQEVAWEKCSGQLEWGKGFLEVEGMGIKQDSIPCGTTGTCQCSYLRMDHWPWCTWPPWWPLRCSALHYPL